MKQRRLGKNGPLVSAIGLGRGSQPVQFGTPLEQEFNNTIHRAIDLGITLFDSSDAYWGTRHEVLLGKAVKGKSVVYFHCADLVGIDLRRLRAGGTAIASRLYVALRDGPWNTIPPVVTGLDVRREARSFLVTFRATHRHEALELAWDGRIEGGEDGTIRYAMDGTTTVPIVVSRVGLNLHLDLGAVLGRPYRANAASGPFSGTIATDVVPQRWDGHALHGAFPSFTSLELAVADGLTVRLSIEGDELEVEDHRNWTDANLKVYAQPLALGFPLDGALTEYAVFNVDGLLRQIGRAHV